ncbi:alpha/beta fold hydrolase [Nocardiopsis ganjiahuensis]|uniref:alpha/beta fold hydrolase n=1 Tax=Nocardiopsis ganjiahuensis TaxID=239984 RepID=UPI00034C04A6|nr:alpha/beta hydrolase [Nocardiopsis ganjiahuensis]
MSERVRLQDGAELFCTAPPRPGTTAVVLLHGGPGLWDYLGPVADLLDTELPVYRYDQRGCGRSSASGDLSVERYVADLEELRLHWGHERLVLIGHSFGAALALAYAGSRPEHAASVGYLCGVGIGDWRAPYKAESARRRAAAGIDRRLTELSERRRTAAEEVEWRRLRWSTDYADTANGLEASRAMAETPLAVNPEANRRVSFTDADQLRWAARTTCPVFFASGSADPRPYANSLLLAAETPRARTRVIEGAGHLPWVERPDTVRDLLKEVIRAAAAGPGNRTRPGGGRPPERRGH